MYFITKSMNHFTFGIVSNKHSIKRLLKMETRLSQVSSLWVLITWSKRSKNCLVPQTHDFCDVSKANKPKPGLC